MFVGNGPSPPYGSPSLSVDDRSGGDGWLGMGRMIILDPDVDGARMEVASRDAASSSSSSSTSSSPELGNGAAALWAQRPTHQEIITHIDFTFTL